MTAITRTLHPRPVILVAGLLAAVAVSVPLGAIVGGRPSYAAAAVALGAGLLTLGLADRSADRLLVGGADAIRLAGATGALLAVPTALLAYPLGAAVPIDRVAGPDRVATAIAVSQEAFSRAPAAVVVGAGSAADAVVGARLAAHVGGPLLLAGEGVGDEIERLGAGRVLVVGGGVELPELPVGAVPVARADRYATAAAVATRIRPERVYVTSSWEEAVPVPVRGDEAVLLTPHDRLLPSTIAALQRTQPSEVVVLDARANVLAFLRALLPDAVVERGSAPVPAETGRAAAWPWVAAEGSWPDAVTAGTAAAEAGRPLLLVPAEGGSSIDDGVRWLRRNRRDISELTVVGGLVTDEVLEEATGRR